MEIAAYRKLLESEEERLNMSQTGPIGSGTPRSGFGIGGGKRKRTFLEESSETSEIDTSKSCKGDIEVVEADSLGRFVRLHNKSNKVCSIVICS